MTVQLENANTDRTIIQTTEKKTEKTNTRSNRNVERGGPLDDVSFYLGFIRDSRVQTMTAMVLGASGYENAQYSVVEDGTQPSDVYETGHSFPVTPFWIALCLKYKLNLATGSSILFYPIPLGQTRRLPNDVTKNIILSVTGYKLAGREVVGHLARSLGCNFSQKMSSSCTHLICKEPQGQKWRKAKEWGIPRVTRHWLEAVAKTRKLQPMEEWSVGELPLPGERLKRAAERRRLNKSSSSRNSDTNGDYNTNASPSRYVASSQIVNNNVHQQKRQQEKRRLNLSTVSRSNPSQMMNANELSQLQSEHIPGIDLNRQFSRERSKQKERAVSNNSKTGYSNCLKKSTKSHKFRQKKHAPRASAAQGGALWKQLQQRASRAGKDESKSCIHGTTENVITQDNTSSIHGTTENVTTQDNTSSIHSTTENVTTQDNTSSLQKSTLNNNKNSEKDNNKIQISTNTADPDDAWDSGDDTDCTQKTEEAIQEDREELDIEYNENDASLSQGHESQGRGNTQLDEELCAALLQCNGAVTQSLLDLDLQPMRGGISNKRGIECISENSVSNGEINNDNRGPSSKRRRTVSPVPVVHQGNPEAMMMSQMVGYSDPVGDSRLLNALQSGTCAS